MLTQSKFEYLWYRARTAVSYDDAYAARFATGSRLALMPGNPPEPVWYALVGGRVIEGYDNGCHPAAMPSIYDRQFATPDEAYAALETESRVSDLKRI